MFNGKQYLENEKRPLSHKSLHHHLFFWPSYPLSDVPEMRDVVSPARDFGSLAQVMPIAGEHVRIAKYIVQILILAWAIDLTHGLELIQWRRISAAAL